MAPASSTKLLAPDPPAPTCAVKVSIHYCEPGNYEKVARRLADALAAEFRDISLETVIVPSAGGAFEVRVDGRLVYSKKATFRFPSHDEIYYHVRAAATPPRGSSLAERGRGARAGSQ